MRALISISKSSYGYVLDVKSDDHRFISFVGSEHLEYAAIAMIAIWARQRDNPDGATVFIPPDVKVELTARCPIPWDKIFNT